MDRLTFIDGCYESPARSIPLWRRMFPSLSVHARFIGVVFRSSKKARQGTYDGEAWRRSSLRIIRYVEDVGGRFEITGMDHVVQLDRPCVFISNHMSILETVVLPAMIQPLMEVTFVVKQSLLEYPVFKHVMRSRDPIAVTRTDPRADMKAVMKGGEERLGKGRSIIVFPQTTRSTVFDPKQFNSIGIKLARRAGAPVVPIALKTDAWGNGKLIKDFGKIDPAKEMHFAFGEPFCVHGRGAEEHDAVIEFILRHLREWGAAQPEH